MRFVLLSAYSASVNSAFYGTYAPTTGAPEKVVGEYRDVYADLATISPYKLVEDSFYDSHRNFAVADVDELDRVYHGDYYDDSYHIRYNDPADHLPAIDLDENGRFPIRTIEV